MKKYLYFFLVVIFFISCRTSNIDIDKYYDGMEYGEIIKYLEKSWEEPLERDFETNKYAIDKLLTSNDSLSLQALEEKYFDRRAPLEIHKYILVAFNNHNITFSNFEYLISTNWYKSDERIRMLNNYKEFEIYQYCYDILKSSHRGEDFINGKGLSELINIIAKYKSIDGDKDLWITQLTKAVEIDKQYQLLVIKRDSLLNIIKETKNEIADLVRNLDKAYPIENLDFYIIRKTTFDVLAWEAIKANTERCIVINMDLINTKFTHQGWYNLNVVSYEPMDIVLDGGFVQKWDVYSVVTQGIIDGRGQMKKDLNSSKSQLKKLERELSAVERKINSW